MALTLFLVISFIIAGAFLYWVISLARKEAELIKLGKKKHGNNR